MTTAPTTAAKAELAPGGKLRVGINYGNFLLVQRDPQTKALNGVAPDLARELGRRLDAATELVPYDSAGRMADAVGENAWDVAFLAAEPARANQIAFTAAYVEIESSYLVPPGSPFRAIEDVDRPGVRIACAAKSAYDLYLTRSLKHAQLVRAEGIPQSYELFVSQKLDALAGLKPGLVADAPKLPGSRVLEGRFTAVQQGIGTPKARGVGAEYLRRYVEDVKASGLVAKLIEKHGIRGLTVAQPCQTP
jgi:polar amino acid transport system substrate-binding protein